MQEKILMPRNLSPQSTVSAVILTSTGSADLVATALPFGVYTGSVSFLSGASAQVAYTYKKLGGDVVDIELTPSNVYAAYEEAVLEYSYILNLHQGKNVLSNVLGSATGSFNYLGEQTAGPSGSNLKYPRYSLGYSRRVGDAAAAAGGFGGTIPQYSASFKTVQDQQDYDLQSIISAASDSGTDDGGNAVDYAGKVGNKRVIITKVYYKTPRAMWRFYGYYGGLNVIGNMSTYGQFSDDSTFEVVPTWQNKMQAMAYEDSIFTRTSLYSFEIINNKLRLYPTPSQYGFGDGFNSRMWVKFYVDLQPYELDGTIDTGIEGVNNMNTLPFDNIPFESINSMGQQWIRKYALALSKEMLGQIRGKFTTIPIPGESVTLNHSDLLSQAKDEQASLKDKLREILKETEYAALAKEDQEVAEAATNVLKVTPLPIFVG
jgi:hypothetical protein